MPVMSGCFFSNRKAVVELVSIRAALTSAVLVVFALASFASAGSAAPAQARKPCKCEATEKQIKIALANARQAFGPESAEASFALVELGKVHQHQLRYDDAAVDLVHAAQIQMSKLGKEDLRTAYTEGLLATVYRDRGDAEQARIQARLAMKTLLTVGKTPLPAPLRQLQAELARILSAKPTAAEKQLEVHP